MKDFTMANSWIFVLLLLVCVNVLGALAGGWGGHSKHKGRHRGDSQEHDGRSWHKKQYPHHPDRPHHKDLPDQRDEDDVAPVSLDDDKDDATDGREMPFPESEDGECTSPFSSEEEHPHHRPHDRKGGEGRKHHQHHHGHHGRGHHKWHWTEGAGLAVLIIIICVSFAVLALLIFLTFKVHKWRLRQTLDDEDKKMFDDMSCPEWARDLVYEPELSVGFGLISEGFTKIGANHVIRNKKGPKKCDGASWGAPITKGKHVFEITFPFDLRGSNASVGVGTPEAPIRGSGKQPLVGSDGNSWGLDLVARKARHGNKNLKKCPPLGHHLPDRFSMFVDADAGSVGFGNGYTYWDDILTDLFQDGRKPLNVMIGASRHEAEITVEYKGSAPDGENNKGLQSLPHHLPPLYTSDILPTYSETQETKVPITVAPAATDKIKDECPEETTDSVPPPPYVITPADQPILSNTDDGDKKV